MSPGGAGIEPDRVVSFAAMTVPETTHRGLTVLRAGHKPYTMSSTDELARDIAGEVEVTGDLPSCDDEGGDPEPSPVGSAAKGPDGSNHSHGGRS